MTDLFLNIFKHLLPNAAAWRITKTKNLRQLFEGLTSLGGNVKLFTDSAHEDFYPQKTRELDQWEAQFALPDVGQTEQERRDRLDGAWKALGGQDLEYIQTTLNNSGFPVTLHEWYEPGSKPALNDKTCATPRNPLLVLDQTGSLTIPMVDCGEPLAQCGELFAEAGNSLNPTGYALVNKLTITGRKVIPQCGEALAQCGEESAQCGNFTEFTEELREYPIPTDKNKWPYFLYIGGAIFGESAIIDSKRRNEFETLCLKICPTQQWLGIIVNYQ